LTKVHLARSSSLTLEISLAMGPLNTVAMPRLILSPFSRLSVVIPQCQPFFQRSRLSHAFINFHQRYRPFSLLFAQVGTPSFTTHFFGAFEIAML
jgi:hypothetical protein